jgi:dTDP-4-dehydrorhamnose 3,5-epimerase
MTARFTCHPTPLAGLMVIERHPITDERGSFERLYCTEELASANIPLSVAQANRSVTARKGALRGMHFQYPPHAEAKLVSCLAGKVFDVAVDLRRGSSTFLRWHAEELANDNHKSLLIPAGFAHGFQALVDNCELLYFHSAAYAAKSEGGIQPTDLRLGIAWPLPIADVSARDLGHPALTDAFEGLVP